MLAPPVKTCNWIPIIENEARQAALVESLRDRIREMESTHGTLENMRSRTEATVNQLTEEKRQFEEKVCRMNKCSKRRRSAALRVKCMKISERA